MIIQILIARIKHIYELVRLCAKIANPDGDIREVRIRSIKDNRVKADVKVIKPVDYIIIENIQTKRKGE